MSFENRIRSKAAHLVRRAGKVKPLLFSKVTWTGKAIRKCLDNEDFRTAFFRFLDLYPSLQNQDAVAEHSRQYFCAPEVISDAESLGFQCAGPKGTANTVGALEAASRLGDWVSGLLRTFLAGETPVEALPAFEKLRSRGAALSGDILGEAVVSEREAEAHLNRYLEFLDTLSDAGKRWRPLGGADSLDWGCAPLVNISVKPFAMYSQARPQALEHSIGRGKERLRPLLRKAINIGAHVTLDMEQRDLKNLTLALYRSLLEEPEFRGYPYTGVIIQSYLRESEEDLKELLAWARQRKQPFSVRLVKGAYWELERAFAAQRSWPLPFFEEKHLTDANFEKLSRLLLRNHRLIYSECASHNLRSIACFLETAEDIGVPSGRYEFQLLYGMADQVLDALVSEGLPVRVYAPVGELNPGMAYLLRRLIEVTSPSSFLRDFYASPAGKTRAALFSAPTKKRVKHAVIERTGISGGVSQDFRNEPAADWTIERVREGFREAIGKVRKSLPLRVPLTIAGKKAETDSAVTSRNPNAPEEVIGIAESGGRVEAENAVLAAREALPLWGGLSPSERASYLFGAAGAARKMRDELSALQVLEAGMTFAALAAGNTVVYKPSSITPACGSMLKKIYEGAELPKGVFTFIPGPGSEVGETLITHPEVALIAFTGSSETGVRIIGQASVPSPSANHFKSMVAEMGGKNAIIIDESADLDEAVVQVVRSAFSYQGQKCSACSRVIVLEGVYRRFTRRLTETASSIEIGPVEDPKNMLGALIDASARERVLGYIEIGKREGKPLLLREPTPGPGHTVPLAIFTDILPSHRIAQEEIFGPVIAVMRAKDLSEALEMANGTQYAPTGGLFSRSPDHIRRFQRKFSVGNLYVNRGITGAVVGRHSFGGYKMSGLGTKAGGPDYLLHFMLPRCVAENTVRRGFVPKAD